MPYKMTFRQRMNAGFILAMSFLLVFASNRINRQHYSNVEHNVNSVFENRVVAQGYIYELNNHFHEKERLLAKLDLKSKTTKLNSRIEVLLADFGKTELTKKEVQYFKKLNDNYSKLIDVEVDMHKKNSVDLVFKPEMNNLLQKIGNNLDELSQVQLDEGMLLTQLSTKSLQMNQMLASLEIAFLVIIGILLLLIIFPKETQKLKLVKKDA